MISASLFSRVIILPTIFRCRDRSEKREPEILSSPVLTGKRPTAITVVCVVYFLPCLLVLLEVSMALNAA